MNNLDSKILIKTCDMHTAGEPLRIIYDGYPNLKGENLLQKRKYALENLDSYRKILMFEPRGHYDMYGALITEPDNPKEADFAVLFMHNEGYSTMCGHAVIALGRYAIDNGLIKQPITYQNEVRIQCPCGIVKATVDVNNGIGGFTKFHSVPAFAYKTGVDVNVPKYGTVKLDISFGGAFYTIVPAANVNLDVKKSNVESLVKAATAISEAAKKQIPIEHPFHQELSFIYGTILTDGPITSETESTTNICVFAKSAVDRSPTGSGVTARMALAYAKKQVKIGEKIKFESVIGSSMIGCVVSETKYRDFPAAIVEVGGNAYYTGMHQFVMEKNDSFQEGFLLRH